ncbi:MAG: hypothetical protein JWP87_843 [Labilithrix sp.]|nr:hypothetical protein [Labilithrix sp.]
MSPRIITLLLPVALVAMAPTELAACDPVHEDATAALGDEAPGVQKGPLHRPGQPCTTCHDGALGNPPKFSVAGTVYIDELGAQAASNAVVSLTDSTGKKHDATTNTAGNFYLRPGEFTPSYPMKVSVAYSGINVTMTSEIGRAGSCADCHTHPAGPTSAGLIYMPADGGTP